MVRSVNFFLKAWNVTDSEISLQFNVFCLISDFLLKIEWKKFDSFLAFKMKNSKTTVNFSGIQPQATTMIEISNKNTENHSDSSVEFFFVSSRFFISFKLDPLMVTFKIIVNCFNSEFVFLNSISLVFLLFGLLYNLNSWRNELLIFLYFI